ncbi:MAG: AtpZ/AtpI family protein [Pseudomonadota bacterium]
MPSPDPDKLKRLETRINAARSAHAPTPKAEDHYSMADVAWRMVIELVAGIGIGFGIGYGLDNVFGTIPIFMILFIGLGLAAGIRTMMRTAEEVQKKQMAHAAKDDEKG